MKHKADLHEMKTCSIFIHFCDSYVFGFVCMIIRSTQSMRANMMNDDVNELLVFSLSLYLFLHQYKYAPTMLNEI